jgi:CspA family cold shock protein
VHFSNVQMEGFRHLEQGETVTFTYEAPGFKQDGYDYRAIDVWQGRRDSVEPQSQRT